MNEKTRNGAGFYLAVLATVIGLISVILYRNSLYTVSRTYVLLIASVVIGAGVLVLSAVRGASEIGSGAMIVEAVLVILAAAMSAAPMVNEVANWIAGLNQYSEISGYVNFVVAALVSWLLYLISAFVGVGKNKI